MSDAHAFEIDHGEPVAPPAPRQPTATALAEDPAMRAALAEAIATVGASGAVASRIDLQALVLGALCASGLGALLRIEEWSAGPGLALLLTIGAVLAVVAAWRWARTPAESLSHRPLPAQPPASVLSAHDGAERERLRLRNEADIAAIALLAANSETRGLRLRCARRAAVFGAIVGLVVGCGGLFAPAGASFFAVGLAASVAAALAWYASGQDWPQQRPAVMAAAAVPGTALIIMLLCGGGLGSAIAATVAATAVGAVTWWRRNDLLKRFAADGATVTG